MKFLTLLLSLTLVANTFACSMDGKEGFLPENKMRIPVGMKGRNGGLSEQQFNAVIDTVINVYSPIVANMGKKLSVARNWTDATVNAYAQQQGPLWIVAMFGGLARHETITEDGFALVVCHELGHHIGGAPAKAGRPVSNEGQADYFAALKCLRRVWQFEDNQAAITAMTDVPKSLIDSCGRQHVWNQDVAMCIRTGMAGMSVAKLFHAFTQNRAVPKFETPDTSVVTLTDDNHPDYQCRLDTFLQGSLCTKSFNEDVSQYDEVKGTCHASTGYKVGLRPTCWFRPSAR